MKVRAECYTAAAWELSTSALLGLRSNHGQSNRQEGELVCLAAQILNTSVATSRVVSRLMSDQEAGSRLDDPYLQLHVWLVPWGSSFNLDEDVSFHQAAAIIATVALMVFWTKALYICM